MFKTLKKYIDIQSMSFEMKIFDILHIICFISVLSVSALVYYFFDSITVVYVTFGMAFMFMLTMFEGNRTGRFSSCAIVMSVVFNVIFLPLVFWAYGKFVCVVPLYFLFGLAYTALMVERKKAVFVGAAEIVLYEIFIYIFGNKYPLDYSSLSQSEIVAIYHAAIAGVVLISLYTGAAVRFRYIMYKSEASHAKAINEHAHDEYVANDIFLTNMSHEIRTPMNAIVGNVNLMLDETEDIRMRNNIYNILNSCDAFISVVDELMNLAKAENRDIQIEKNRFDFYSMLMEIVNMVSVRMLDKTSEFYVEAKEVFPRKFVGDAAKIRQILVNVINTVEKNSKDARITLRIDFDDSMQNGSVLSFEVNSTAYSLTGKESSERDDDEQNIIICKEIAEKMGGRLESALDGNCISYFMSIPVDSIDDIEEVERLKKVKNASVIFIEKDVKSREALANAFAGMNVDAYDCRGVNDLEYTLSKRHFTHLFIAAELYEECRVILEKMLNGEKVVIITDLAGNIETDEIYASILRPLHIINLYGVLTGEDFYSVYRANNKGNLVLENAKILVVDDNFTNLNVASALLKKYGADVLTAPSGAEAIRLLEDNKVQLIFMDYMMPELDGVETLAAIREREVQAEERTPAVALSANVVAGARDMFMNAGFDAFIPKPIDVKKMEKCLKELLPPECIVEE